MRILKYSEQHIKSISNLIDILKNESDGILMIVENEMLIPPSMKNIIKEKSQTLLDIAKLITSKLE